MTGNTFGRLFRLTTFGESHGPGLGGIVDGCPAGLALSEADIQTELEARRPGQGGAAVTARKEPDRIRLLSGVFEGLTTGTPIGFLIENTDQRSGDYAEIARLFRPGHADLGFQLKYGRRDPRGGGRSSGRETVSRVAGGAVAQTLLREWGIFVRAYTVEFGGFAAPVSDPDGAGSRPFFASDAAVVEQWEALAQSARSEGDSLGALVRVEAFGLPAGLGEPVFDKLDARLAYALMGVGTVKGVEIGRGFAAAGLKGSEHNDPILPAGTAGGSSAEGTAGCGLGAKAATGVIPSSGRLNNGAGYAFAGNNAGGILGGISTGAPLSVTVAVKPIASIAKEQRTVTVDGEAVPLVVKGRHDVSAVPRIVPVLKAMTALVLADFVLLQRGARL